MRIKTQNWQDLITHIDKKFKEVRGFGYPFTGRDFKDLKDMVRHFEVWGVMALWDVYMSMDSEYIKKQGYAIYNFCRSIPWLTDKDWKSRAQKYEKELCPPIKKEIQELFEFAVKDKK